jgi:hypothetical protein
VVREVGSRVVGGGVVDIGTVGKGVVGRGMVGRGVVGGGMVGRGVVGRGVVGRGMVGEIALVQLKTHMSGQHSNWTSSAMVALMAAQTVFPRGHVSPTSRNSMLMHVSGGTLSAVLSVQIAASCGLRTACMRTLLCESVVEGILELLRSFELGDSTASEFRYRKLSSLTSWTVTSLDLVRSNRALKTPSCLHELPFPGFVISTSCVTRFEMRLLRSHFIVTTSKAVKPPVFESGAGQIQAGRTSGCSALPRGSTPKLSWISLLGNVNVQPLALAVPGVGHCVLG